MIFQTSPTINTAVNIVNNFIADTGTTMLTGALCMPLKKNTNPKILNTLSAMVNKKGVPKLNVCTVHPLKKRCLEIQNIKWRI